MKTLIDAQGGHDGVEPLCKGLAIAPATDYLHAARQVHPGLQPARWLRDAQLKAQIQAVWQANYKATTDCSMAASTRLFTTGFFRLISCQAASPPCSYSCL